ncbi:MAG TPA: wax ester/triacylglycerol synthase family O-acyltransferase [Solirubrobacteraceae bacterium]|nr:wax ester/triacylglycerol synthase family O-acyltransferase [Solirubrobacteraceae bacterium]
MSNPDRLSGLDSSFLHLERDHAHMHVAAAMLLEGPAPAYDELVEHVLGRLHLVPRYRQRLAFVPLGQGRPVWVDDPHFNIGFHVRHAALPSPGGEAELRRLCGRVFSQALDRTRPLWELWLVEGLGEGRGALLSKTHHALVDGISGVDIATVLFDTSPDPMPTGDGRESEWVPRPLPSDAKLLADALLERATVPGEVVRGIRHALRGPRQVAERLARAAEGLGAIARVAQSAPPSPFNVRIGPHRRFSWVAAELRDFKAIKDALGGTVNDVVLAVVAGALGRYLARRDALADGLTLRAMVPVSVRADPERGALGNRVTAMWASLPVATEDPIARLRAITEEMGGVKRSGQAVGAEVLTELAGFAPPTIVAQAARLQARQRLFNLVVTNVPGPQHPLHLLGRRLGAIYPMVPLAVGQALGIAIISYDGHLHFGLVADFDALPDLDDLAADLGASIAELLAATGARAADGKRTGGRRTRRSPRRTSATRAS